jgi:hypothetical protein
MLHTARRGDTPTSLLYYRPVLGDGFIQEWMKDPGDTSISFLYPMQVLKILRTARRGDTQYRCCIIGRCSWVHSRKNGQFHQGDTSISFLYPMQVVKMLHTAHRGGTPISFLCYKPVLGNVCIQE